MTNWVQFPVLGLFATCSLPGPDSSPARVESAPLRPLSPNHRRREVGGLRGVEGLSVAGFSTPRAFLPRGLPGAEMAETAT